jgi:hypothetical protein
MRSIRCANLHGAFSLRLQIIMMLTFASVTSVGALPSTIRSLSAHAQTHRGETMRLFGGRGRSRERAIGPPAAAARSGSWNWLTEDSNSRLTKLHKVAMAVSFYFFTSLSLTFANKAIFNKFEYPLFVTCFQQIMTLVLLCTFGTLGQHIDLLSFAPPPEFNSETAIEVIPLTLLYVGMLTGTNYCLRHVDISFYQILRSLVIPFNIVTSKI